MKLKGVRVLDLSQFLPGPHLTLTMADHGADVIMIEPKNGVGEPSRELGLRTKDGIAVWFRNIARGKKSLKLDLKIDADRALFLSLADAVLRFDHDHVRAVIGHRHGQVWTRQELRQVENADAFELHRGLSFDHVSSKSSTTIVT